MFLFFDQELNVKIINRKFPSKFIVDLYNETMYDCIEPPTQNSPNFFTKNIF